MFISDEIYFLKPGKTLQLVVDKQRHITKQIVKNFKAIDLDRNMPIIKILNLFQVNLQLSIHKSRVRCCRNSQEPLERY